jgi:hypothetical protein
MHMMINALVLALASPGPTSDLVGESPKCRADLIGPNLTTQVEFTDGYVVEGPWRVVEAGKAPLDDGQDGHYATAVLERLVEIDPITGEKRMTHFRSGVRIDFRGRTSEELVRHAAQLWCSTVIRSRPAPDSRFAPGPIRRLPIALDTGTAQSGRVAFG